MVSVILDADFLSSFLKIGKLDRVRDYFQVETLLLPPAVFREVAATSVNVPAFLLAYKASRQDSGAEIREMVVALEEKDHYGFSEEIRRLLLA